MSYKPKKKKFLNANEIETTIEEVRIIANEERVNIALLGGAAMQIYGSDRLTTDVDFVGDDTLPLKNMAPIEFDGVPSGAKGLAPNGVPVDVIVRRDAYGAVYNAALHNAQLVEGLDVPVILPEYLAAIKLAAGRVKDQGDLEFLILSGELDLTLTRRIVLEHLGQFALNEFNSVVYELEWRSAKERK